MMNPDKWYLISKHMYHDLNSLDTFGLFYDAEYNFFRDEDGFVVLDIFDVITPNDLRLFHLYQSWMMVPCLDMPGVGVELFWPEEDGL